MDRTVVQDWLRSILTPYVDPQRTFADVTSLLDGYPSLSPRTDLYISNVGQSSLLLQLYGTLPIQYRNATYNIPVQIWVTRAYPREPPIAFVSPTNAMLVRKTEDVELDGEVQTEYAKQWTRKWETKNLVAYTQAAQEAFSRQPPVYAKPAASAAASSSSSAASPAPRASPGPSSASRASPAPAPTPAPGGGGKPPPPLPGQAATPSSSSPAPQDGPPQRPPKPNQQPERSNSSPLHSPVVGGAGAFHPTPALPPHRQHQYGPHRAASLDLTSRGGGYGPPQHAQHPHAYGHGDTQSFSQQQQQQQPHHAQSPLAAPPPQGWQSPQPAHGQGHGSFSQAYQQNQPPYPHQDQGGSSTMHHSYGPPQNGHASPAPSAAQPPRPPPLPPAQYAAGPGAGPTPMPAVPTPPAKPRDLLAEDEEDGAGQAQQGPTGPTPAGPSSSSSSAAPPPPLPPNPHLQSLHATLHARLTHRVSEIRAHLTQRNESLHHLATDLSSAPARIEDETARLSVVRDLCLHNATTWESALIAAKARRDELSQRASTRDSDPSAERDFVVADSIVGEQLVGLVAQDMALTDVLYHLARAQEMGASGLGEDLERYLKWVRGLAREQFLKRGLAGKIGRGLEGMDG